MPSSLDIAALARAVRRDHSLSHGARTLFAEVCDLHVNADGCYASDTTLGAWIGTSARTIRRYKVELMEAGYLAVDERDGRRYLTPTRGEPGQYCPSGVSVKSDQVDNIDRQNCPPVDKSDQKSPDNSVQHQDIYNTPVGVVSEGARPREEPPGDDDGEPTSEHGGPSMTRCLSIGRAIMLPGEEVRAFWHHYEARGWEVRGSPIREPRSLMQRWKQNMHRFKDRTNGKRKTEKRSAQEQFEATERLKEQLYGT